MYGAQFGTYVVPEKLAGALCGRTRPGHFRGVCTVVAKLFNIVGPDLAFFGQKDAQQAVIIQRMIEDLNFPVEMEVLPIIREPDGLALSSRNACLSPAQRQEALCLSRALQTAFEVITRGERSAAAVRQRLAEVIQSAPSAVVDYVELVDAPTLASLTDLAGHQVLIALAVRFGATRLIDNIVIDIT
jgi:pantoate--beta-alanine ligase